MADVKRGGCRNVYCALTVAATKEGRGSEAEIDSGGGVRIDCSDCCVWIGQSGFRNLSLMVQKIHEQFMFNLFLLFAIFNLDLDLIFLSRPRLPPLVSPIHSLHLTSYTSTSYLTALIAPPATTRPPQTLMRKVPTTHPPSIPGRTSWHARARLFMP